MLEDPDVQPQRVVQAPCRTRSHRFGSEKGLGIFVRRCLRILVVINTSCPVTQRKLRSSRIKGGLLRSIRRSIMKVRLFLSRPRDIHNVVRYAHV